MGEFGIEDEDEEKNPELDFSVEEEELGIEDEEKNPELDFL